MENICKFPGSNYVDDSIQILNFVRENQPLLVEQETLPSVFMLYLVLSGEGALDCGGRTYALHRGTVFLTFPAKPYSLRGSDTFRYSYLSFIGLGAPVLLESLCIMPPCAVADGYEDQIGFWMQALSLTNTENHCLISRSILFYTLALIGRPKPDAAGACSNPAVRQILRRVEDQYFDPNLSLGEICEQLRYNPKYISRAFKKAMGISYTAYLQEVRVRHACSLLSGGVESAKTVSCMVGFQDPLYFSRVFKKITSYTPRAYVQAQRDQQVRSEAAWWAHNRLV